MRIAAIAAFGLLLSAAQAGVSPARAESLEDRCDQSSNVEISACISKAYEEVDAELNAAWKKVLATLGDPADVNSRTYGMSPDDVAKWKADLVGAQQAWVTFKEKDCNGATLYEYWGGSGAGIAVTSCLYAHTADRLADLKSRYLER